MEDYEKKYKEALERAKKWYYAPNADKMPTYANRIIKEIFPELKNKDEEIRKALIKGVESCKASGWTNFGNNVDIDVVLAWLKEQGKQKPIDYNKELKKCRENPLYFFDKYVKLEKQKPACSEEDERVKKRILLSLEKDLMATKNSGCDTQDLEQCIAWLEKQESVREVVERCKNSWYNEGKIAGMAEGLTNDEKYQQGWHDALEKQCQTFTKKDVDDAYLKGICDTKHELEKQGEQKPTVVDFNAKDWYVSKVDGKIHDMTYNPTDKVEPFDKYEGLTDFERTLADICIGWIGEELGWKQYIKDNADVLLKIAIKKFNSIQDAPFKQKPAAWSEEDELVVLSIEQVIKCASFLNLVPEKLDKIDKWLKSLKQRYTWKPSKEQIEALDDALNERGFDYNYLNSLYEQLKKL